MSLAIGIVAHTTRADMAHKLQVDVGAAYMSIDKVDGRGCFANHKRVWEHLNVIAKPETWCIVLEDDAIPVDGFRIQLQLALHAAPTQIVSLYLGQQRPPQYQYMIEPAIRHAVSKGAHWLVSRQVIHAVGLAIRSDLLPDMLENLDDKLPIDEAINGWANRRHYRTAYTWPSLVDHADGETLLKHRDGQARETGRVAWKTGTRDTWENVITEMNG